MPKKHPLLPKNENLKRLLRRQPRPPVGSAPGTIRPAEGALRPQISFFQYSHDHVDERVVESPADLAAPMAQTGVLWVNVVGIGDPAILSELGERFGLHPLALADVAHVDQRAKAETYDEHLFLVMRMVRGASGEAHEQLSLFVRNGCVITFQERAGDCFDLVRERLRNPKGRIRQRGADYLAYALIDAVIDAYFAPLESLADRLDELEEAVLKEPSVALVHKLHVIKRDLLLLRRAVWPLREAINLLLRDDAHEVISSEVRPYLRDCYDHTIQVMDLLETYRELAASQMELYVSTISQRTNEIMKVLTMFASIFIPLTFIVGIYGMNFDPDYSPWNMPEIRWTYGYPLILLFMAAVTLSILWFFKRRGWMG